jgi:hypothetical protein
MEALERSRLAELDTYATRSRLVLGTVCVMDTRIRSSALTFNQGLSMEALARQVMVHGTSAIIIAEGPLGR